jgi:hypothetical protein
MKKFNIDLSKVYTEDSPDWSNYKGNAFVTFEASGYQAVEEFKAYGRSDKHNFFEDLSEFIANECKTEQKELSFQLAHSFDHGKKQISVTFDEYELRVV